MWTIFFAPFLPFVVDDEQYGFERGQSNMDMSGGRALLPTCPGMWQWPCRNGECIPQYDVCNGIPQCSDGSDEWNCNDISRLKLNPGKAAEIAANGGMVATTTTTTTTVSSMSNLNLTKNQFFVMLGVTAVLCVAIILFVRRRARMRAVSRNRRIGMGLIRDDSDEDDILISSMYS